MLLGRGLSKIWNSEFKKVLDKTLKKWKLDKICRKVTVKLLYNKQIENMLNKDKTMKS